MTDSLGAWRCAQALWRRFGLACTVEAVEALARAGTVGRAGRFKDRQLYAVPDLDLVTGPQLLAAMRAGWEAPRLNHAEAARYLGVRLADFGVLVKAGLIVPDERKYGQWQGWVRLYLPASLDEFAARPDIDWAAVRATPRNQRTPLYYLAEPGLAWLALGGDPPPPVRPRPGAV